MSGLCGGGDEPSTGKSIIVMSVFLSSLRHNRHVLKKVP
jgi:hypothetical protein